MDSIRVWLETNYDHGRTGAWLLDLPGAFTWGQTRETALARVTSAAHRFTDWAMAHGEDATALPMAMPEVVDEVAAYTLADGYEVNATFLDDDRSVDGDEVETAIRRLGNARSDLVELVGRIRHLEASGRRLPSETRSDEAKATGADDGKSVDEVLRHLAGAEAWFVSRLDPAARYEGTRENTDDYLGASREFLIDGLRRLQATDVQPRTDSKGERWTLAKLLRRAVYHSLDHLEELDRRLALAERRLDRVQLRRDRDIEPSALRTLFASAGLFRRAIDDDEMTRRWLAGTQVMASAWDGQQLVGLVRMISDEATNAYVSTLAVSPRWQDRGLGTRLMRSVIEGRETMKLVVESAPGAEQFYERLGFDPAPNAFIRLPKTY